MKNVETLLVKRLKQLLKQDKWDLIGPGALLKEDLGLDSMRLVGLFSQVSSDMKIDLLSFGDADLLQLRTVGDLTNLFASRQTA